jgi:uncharacterized paraquat-inducible protein A
MRCLYDILITGARNSDESVRSREAGWNAMQSCERCKIAPQYTKEGVCLRCRRDDVRENEYDTAWMTDEALSR